MRNIYVSIVALFTCFNAIGQVKNFEGLIGKWKQIRSIKSKDTLECVFVNDTTFVIKDVEGYYKNVYRYHFDFSKDPVILTSLHKNRNGDNITICLKFINVNTLIFKTVKIGTVYNNSYDPKNVGLTFTRVDNKDYSAFANPTLVTLRGAWIFNKFKIVNFINDTLATLKDGRVSANLYTYTIDFTKFPYWVEFKSLENKKPRHGIFTFPTDSTLVFETFKGNDKRDNFTTFGRYHYIKLDSAKIAAILKRRQGN